MLTTRTKAKADQLLGFSFGGFLHGVVWAVVLASGVTANAQAPVSLVKFEAESGVLGSDFVISNSTNPAYITITTDFSGSYPSNAARVATYTITFPTAATYQLYARVRVGSGGFSDDSLFYGNGFGTKDATNSADWILVNGLGGAGFNNPTNVVTGGGSLSSGVWKWINLSSFAPGASFTVTNGNLTQTFQMGAREDGLDLDAFVFGANGVTYTVSNLDAGVDGQFPAAGVTAINWNDVHQRIDGFGGGVVFLDAGLDPMTDVNMNTLFGTNNASQLGLTLLRVRIAPNEGWTNNNFSSWSTSLADAQKAVARGAKVIATPWTPPASMKTNNNIVGGALSANQFANYANYLNTFAGYLKSHGVPLAAVSVQNEPDFLATYESCVWTGSQMQTFFHNNASVITNALVMMPESFHYNKGLSDPALNDPVAVTNIAVVGLHLYGGVISDYPNVHNRGIPTWMTEYLVNDQTIDSAISTAQQIHDCLVTGNMSGYVWWKTAGDANGLINAFGVPQKRGFVMAQFSRFVRPGYARIGATNSDSAVVSTYRDTNSTAFVIVAINPTAFPLSPTFNLQGFPSVASVTPWITSADLSLATQSSVTVTNLSFAYTLPAMSVVSFVGAANNPPTLSVPANQTINPGVMLRVTNFANDPDLPAQSLTFTLLNGPTNASIATINSTSVRFTWRPLISQSDSTNIISVKVSDDGAPSLSATNNFVITVNPVIPPTLSSVILSNGQTALTAVGLLGPDYTLLASSNLMNWQVSLTTNPTTMPVTFIDTNRMDPPRFYRLQLGP